MNHILFIAKRYIFSKSGNNAINIIVKIASIGILVVSTAFIIVLSGFSGIKTFNLNLIKKTDAELVITPKKGKTLIFNSNLEKSLQNKLIQNYSPVIEEKVFINFEDKQTIAKIKGIDTNYYKIVPIDNRLFSDDLPAYNSKELLVGITLAIKLSLNISSNDISQISILVPKPGKGLITDPRKAFNQEYFFPVGLYQTTIEHDGVYIYADIKSVQKLLNKNDNEFTGIEIKTINPEHIENLKKQLLSELGNQYFVKDRKEQNILIYKMLKIENLMTYFILSLILLLALFNIIGSIMMIIIDKKNNIFTLKQLGLSISEIRKIFLYQGFGLIIISGTIGIIIGIIIVFIQIYYPFFYIPQTSMVYPVELHFINVLWVFLTLIFMGITSTAIAIRKIE